MHFSSTLFASGFLTLANGAVLDSRASLSGEATFYDGNLAGGTCSFSTYTLPAGIFGTAFSGSAWDNAANCGACVAVTGPSGTTLTAMIVDQCPECSDNHLDLFSDAFSKLADPKTGVIDISWTYVDCPITSALQVHNKDGVSKYWFSMQVVNANKAVKSLEVSTDGGSTWQPTARQDYNFFENSLGFGTATVDVKVTSVDGETVILKNVGISSGSSVTALSNFGSANAVAPVASSFSTSIPSDYITPTPVATSDTSVKVVATPTTLPGANFQETETPTALTSSYAAPVTSSAVAVLPTPSSYLSAIPNPPSSSSTSTTKTTEDSSEVTPPSSHLAAAATAQTSLAAVNTYNTTATASPSNSASSFTFSSAAAGTTLSPTTAVTSIPFTGASARVSIGIESFLVSALALAVLVAAF